MQSSKRGGLLTTRELKDIVIADGNLLTVPGIVNITGRKAQFIQEQMLLWEQEQRILVLRDDGQIYTPGFAIVCSRDYFEPLPIVADLIEMLAEKMGSWQMTLWLISASSFLNWQCPRQFLNDDPQAVLQAARITAEGQLHG